MAKMHEYGFDIESLKLINSYLAGRKQSVKINSPYAERSRVPQGTILDPLLFNLYICDMFFREIEIDLENYAGDATPYTCDIQMEKVIETLTISMVL